MEQKYDVVVIGGGPAGLAAAIEAKKNDVKSVLVIERDRELGGILQQCIHNGFGLHVFKEELTGPEYAERFIEEMKVLGIMYKLDTMVLDISENKVVTMVNAKEGIAAIQAKSVVLAMGCRERTRGALNIPGTRPAGIFTAGTAQRFVNMEGYMVGKKIVILGSGDIGLIMARRLTLEGAEVQAVVEIMPFSSGLVRNIVQCLDDYGIPLFFSHTVTEIRGRYRVEGITVAKVDKDRRPIPGTEMNFECDTLLLSVGLIPENELSKSAGIKIDPVTGGPAVNESMETSIKGIFACGNVVHVHDLVDFVTEESRCAGRSAAKHVRNQLNREDAGIQTRPGKGVRYIVPQSITAGNLDHSLDIFLRVDNIYNNKRLVIKTDNRILKTINKKRLTPGEMEHIRIDFKDIKGKNISLITVEVEEI